ncbi:MAG: alanyl-tRNA editing protein [Alphaproteobacteria bacterium]|nr:alanyl-tRNA editing protein [Alphaproteobacteria bacterium]
MEKLFWFNPYQHTLHTKIASIKGNDIVLEETIAYSFSGGQESDKAFIDGIQIVTSRMEGVYIIYTLPEDHGFYEGQMITMTIDWPRRYRLMRLHFAAELILEIVTQAYAYQKVGAHISESKARIDFKTDTNISTIFPYILETYNAVILSDYRIETGFSDMLTQKRYWKIDGFAKVPCGGTHVKSTAEVGFVTLKRAHPGKSIERIEIKYSEDILTPSSHTSIIQSS